MKLFLKGVVSVLSILVVPGLLYAQSASERSGTQIYDRTGFYVGAGGSLAIQNYADGGGSINAAGFGANVKGGYRVTSNLAAEFDFQYANFGVSGLPFEVETFGLTGNAKYYFATDRLQPYVVAGAGLAKVGVGDTLGIGISSSRTDFVARFGGGADYYLTSNIAAYTEVTYILTSGNIADSDIIPISFGLKYRF